MPVKMHITKSEHAALHDLAKACNTPGFTDKHYLAGVENIFGTQTLSQMQRLGKIEMAVINHAPCLPYLDASGITPRFVIQPHDITREYQPATHNKHP
jgi:hypothetical protein